MKDDDIASKLLRRYTMTQSSLGRFFLRFHLELQRLRANWCAYGTSFLKRVVDIVLSLLFLIVLGPFFALIALLVWIEDGRPIFFAQSRVGQFGREFKMYKIRSMCIDA